MLPDCLFPCQAIRSCSYVEAQSSNLQVYRERCYFGSRVLGLVAVPAYERLAYVRGIRAVCALSPPASACERRSHHGALRRWQGEQKEYETVVASGTFDI